MKESNNDNFRFFFDEEFPSEKENVEMLDLSYQEVNRKLKNIITTLPPSDFNEALAKELIKIKKWITQTNKYESRN